MNTKLPEFFSNADAAKRRDEVIRRMANTPPQPKSKTPRPQGRKRKADAGRAAGKVRADREDQTETPSGRLGDC
jgi:hypothetical protein